jgi:sarcosine oxidase subunit alpha
MREEIEVTVNGKMLRVLPGTTAAAALFVAGAFRKSVRGELRAPLCGMGICFECRARVDGQEHVKSCQVICAHGMRIDA